MNPNPALRIARTATARLAAGALAFLLIPGLTRADADVPAAHDPVAMHDWVAKRHAEHVRAHLEELSVRMEVRASQEPAWQAFAKAFKEAMSLPAGNHWQPGSEDIDIAKLTRQHAERAAAHAQQLARLADASAALSQKLDANQRLVFNEAVRHFIHEHMEHGMMGHGMMGHGMSDEGMPYGPGMVHPGDHCEREPRVGPGWHGGMNGYGPHDGMHGYGPHGPVRSDDDDHGGAQDGGPHGDGDMGLRGSTPHETAPVMSGEGAKSQ